MPNAKVYRSLSFIRQLYVFFLRGSCGLSAAHELVGCDNTIFLCTKCMKSKLDLQMQFGMTIMPYAFRSSIGQATYICVSL